MRNNVLLPMIEAPEDAYGARSGQGGVPTELNGDTRSLCLATSVAGVRGLVREDHPMREASVVRLFVRMPLFLALPAVLLLRMWWR